MSDLIIKEEYAFTAQQLDILKSTICKGVTNEEFQVFLMACTKTRLDPFMKQIHAVKRWDSRLKRETMTIQTGIDGYRLIAERTGKYAPGPKPTFEYDDNNTLLSATAYVKKMTPDGTWHVVEAEAFLDEYCQKDKEGRPSGMWRNMARNQLAKCAEALCLRKAFPSEMSGVYTQEEMQQAEVTIPEVKIINQSQSEMLSKVIEECEDSYKKFMIEALEKRYGIDYLSEIPVDAFDRIYQAAIKNKKKTEDIVE